MIKNIYVDIFGTTIVFAVESTIDEWNAYCKKYKRYITDEERKGIIDDINNINCGGSTSFLDNGCFVMYVRNKNHHGDIAHEVFHVCNKILTSRGFVPTDTGESWAYLIGYVTKKFYEIIEKG